MPINNTLANEFPSLPRVLVVGSFLAAAAVYWTSAASPLLLGCCSAAAAALPRPLPPPRVQRATSAPHSAGVPPPFAGVEAAPDCQACPCTCRPQPCSPVTGPPACQPACCEPVCRRESRAGVRRRGLDPRQMGETKPRRRLGRGRSRAFSMWISTSSFRAAFSALR